VLARAEQLHGAGRLPPPLRRLYPATAGQKVASHGALLRLDVVYAAGGHDLASVHPRPRPHIHEVVGTPDRLLVVLNDDERVPEVPQPGESVE
jgi:hypothetical protein